MNIQEEFERFKAFTATDEGFWKIEQNWQIQEGYKKQENGKWQKRSASFGDLLGFAIDPVTWKYEIGRPGEDHGGALKRLIDRLFAEDQAYMLTASDKEIERLLGSPDPVDRALDGRMARFPDWEFPIICILKAHELESEILKAIEDKLLELGIGLPYSGICLEKAFRNKG